MSSTADIRLTCAETPLAWPAAVKLSDLNPCSTCGIKIFAPQSGSLQVLTRRQGDGVGDGVNVDEFVGIGADYRGQRYSFEEAIFVSPGVHVLPETTGVFAAEYHIHLKTLTAPIRAVTLVIPVSHQVAADPVTEAYFASIRAKPEPSATRPTLMTLLTPGTPVLQYQGPDVRGRTADVDSCNATESHDERQFLLVLRAVFINPRDLERIPREGSLSTDPRDLPAQGPKATTSVSKERLLRCSVLATPGILGTSLAPASPPSVSPSSSPPLTDAEMTCEPLKVVDGRDVIDRGGKQVDILKLLGIEGEDTPTKASDQKTLKTVAGVLMFFGTFIGLLIADFIFGYCWTAVFNKNVGDRLTQWTTLKLLWFFGISLTMAMNSDSVAPVPSDSGA